MKARVKWAGDVMFVAESGSGHAVVLEGPPEQGGRNVGIRPMELLLMGVGGCSSYDVVSILRKSRQQVTDCVAELTAERADEVPAVFTKIHLHFIVTGHGSIFALSRVTALASISNHDSAPARFSCASGIFEFCQRNSRSFCCVQPSFAIMPATTGGTSMTPGVPFTQPMRAAMLGVRM